MNDLQYDKYNKMLESDISVLYHAKDVFKNYHFLVDGSTENKYRVTIYQKSGSIECTCADYKLKHKKHTQPKYLCKHCILVIIKYLNLFGRKNAIHHCFYKRGWFTKDEFDSIDHKIQSMGPCKILNSK